MQFSVIFLSSLGFGYAIAQGNMNLKTAASPASTGTPSAGGPANADGKVKVHVVKVGADKAIKFEPNRLTAQVGDMVQFQFVGGNHTVVQSTFDKPCMPISMVDSKITGFYSGYMPTSAATDMAPTYTIMISNMTPVWIYCSQGQHCQKGMTMVINENTKANASRTLENYSVLAANALTVQMKADDNPSGKTPSSPSGALPKPSSNPEPAGDSSKTGDKSPSSGSGSSSGSSNGTKTDDDSKVSPSPISASDKKSASIIMCAVAGLFAFAIVM